MLRTIDQKYLIAAKKIHVSFIGLNERLAKEEVRLNSVKANLQQIVKDLQQTNQQLSKTRNQKDVQPVFKILDDLAVQYQKIENLLQPIVQAIDALRKEELVLFETIQRSYPELTAENIKKQVQDYVFPESANI